MSVNTPLSKVIYGFKMPEKLRNFETVLIGRWLYVIGGIRPNRTISNKIWGITPCVNGVPPKDGRWEVKGRLPRPLCDFKLHYCDTNKILLVLGGRTNFGTRTMNDTRILNFNTDHNGELKYIGNFRVEMPIAVSKYALVVDTPVDKSKTTLTVIGGWINGYGSSYRVFKVSLEDIITIRRITNGNPWTEMCSLPRPLAGITAIQKTNNIYVFGGGDYNGTEYTSANKSIWNYNLNSSRKSGIWVQELGVSLDTMLDSDLLCRGNHLHFIVNGQDISHYDSINLYLGRHGAVDDRFNTILGDHGRLTRPQLPVVATTLRRDVFTETTPRNLLMNGGRVYEPPSSFGRIFYLIPGTSEPVLNENDISIDFMEDIYCLTFLDGDVRSLDTFSHTERFSDPF